MALATKEQYNSFVLKAQDSATAEVFFTSSICNVYKYNLTTGEWDKLDVQGSLFLTSRIGGDDYPYALRVMNRLNSSDFVLGVTPRAISARKLMEPMEVKLDDSLLMVQAEPSEIYGLWLHDDGDRQKCLALLDWCIQNGSAS